MIKFKAIGLSIILIVLSLVSTNLYAFDEFTNENAAQFLKDKGLFEGDNGNLMLDKNLKREEMVVVISRLLGAEKEAQSYSLDNLTFKDVPKDNWASHYIAWAKDNKLVEGYSPEQFGLGDSLTLWQTKAFFVRTLGYTYVKDEDINNSANKLNLLIRVNSSEDNKPILRATMAMIMYNSLYSRCSNGKILGEKLGVIGNAAINKTTLGNSLGNIVNEGLYAYSNSWVFFSKAEDSNKLYKKNVDGSGEVKICDDSAKYINVIDQWIYYQNSSTGNALYKIKIDGTGRQELDSGNCSNIFVIGNKIYYTLGITNHPTAINIDGTGKQSLGIVTDITFGDVCFFGDYVYFTDSSTQCIFRTYLDGRGGQRISDIRAHYLNVQDDWLYFVNQDDNMKLYKIKTDGTQLTKVSDDSCVNINVTNGWIYYVNTSDDRKPYKIKIDGTSKAKLSNQKVSKIFVLDGSAYYTY